MKNNKRFFTQLITFIQPVNCCVCIDAASSKSHLQSSGIKHGKYIQNGSYFRLLIKNERLSI